MENQENKKQQQPERTFAIPRVYVLEGIEHSVKEMHRMLAEARKKYGARYNEKNEYAVCLRRYNLDDYEATLKEYDLIMAKQSKLPASIRNVIRQHGDNAMRYGIWKYQQEQARPAGQTNKQEKTQ